MSDPAQLSRRERQIMDVIYSRGEASANQVLEGLPHPPGNTAVRTLLRILEQKGHLTHRKEGREFIYKPVRPAARVAKSVLRRVLGTFFGGSIEKALAAHLADPKADLSLDDLQRLQDLIEQAKKKGVTP